MIDDFKLYRGVSVVTGAVVEGKLFRSGSNVFIADVHVYEVKPDSVEEFVPTGTGGFIERCNDRRSKEMKRQVRSDIPYKDRLLMQKFNSVKEHRDDAARTAMMVACVALNDTAQLGYTRLVRFAQRFQKLIEEYYADPEVQSVHLGERLSQMGFIVKDGRLLAMLPVDLDGKTENTVDEVIKDAEEDV